MRRTLDIYAEPVPTSLTDPNADLTAYRELERTHKTLLEKLLTLKSRSKDDDPKPSKVQVPDKNPPARPIPKK